MCVSGATLARAAAGASCLARGVCQSTPSPPPRGGGPGGGGRADSLGIHHLTSHTASPPPPHPVSPSAGEREVSSGEETNKNPAGPCGHGWIAGVWLQIISSSSPRPS